MRKKRTTHLILTLLLIGAIIGTVFGAYLTYKSYVEIYGTIHPLGEVEIDIKQMSPIEGLDAREDHIGEIRVWTYSNDTELILQLIQVSNITTNFFEFTVKICQPLDMIFVIDITDSMNPYMDKIKQQLKELVFFLSITHNAPLKFGVVGFKDYDPETVQLPLTDDYEAVKAYIDSLTAGGGGDPPESHYLGLQAAKDDFNTNSKLTHEKVVVFISDAEAGKDDSQSFAEARAEADEMAELGIKIKAVLCGPDTSPQNEQLQYYAIVTGGEYIGPEGQKRIFSGVTSHPTWIVKLTPITPFDSFHLTLNSSPPCQKEGYYTFYVYVSFYANAIPWHDFFFVELMANLEKDQPSYRPCYSENIVVNGGFEEPVVEPTQNWGIYDSDEIPGWFVEWMPGPDTYDGYPRPPEAYIELQREGVAAGWTAIEGYQWAELDSDWDGPGGGINGEPGSVRIYQDLTTMPHGVYNLRFAFSPRPGVEDNKLEVRWDGEVVAILEANGTRLSSTQWTYYWYTVTATSTTTRLEFADLSTPDSLGTFLDDVSVELKCEPTLRISSPPST